VVLIPDEYDPLLNGLIKRNWMKLADPLPKFEKGGVMNLMMKMKWHSLYALPIDLIKSGPLEILSEF